MYGLMWGSVHKVFQSYSWLDGWDEVSEKRSYSLWCLIQFKLFMILMGVFFFTNRLCFGNRLVIWQVGEYKNPGYSMICSDECPFWCTFQLASKTCIIYHNGYINHPFNFKVLLPYVILWNPNVTSRQYTSFAKLLGHILKNQMLPIFLWGFWH